MKTLEANCFEVLVESLRNTSPKFNEVGASFNPERVHAATVDYELGLASSSNWDHATVIQVFLLCARGNTSRVVNLIA